MVWYPHLFKNFLQFVVTHTVKGFDIANIALLNHTGNLCLLYSVLLIVIMLMSEVI